MPLPQTVTIQLDVATGEDLLVAHAIACLFTIITGSKALHAVTMIEVAGCLADGSYTDATIDSLLDKTKALAEAGDARERAR